MTLLRAAVLALVAANLLFFAWTEGWLDRIVGASARAEREPERLQRQVRPETIRVIPPGAALPASAPASAAAAPVACLESAPMTAARASIADAALAALQPPLPAHSWADVATTVTAGATPGWLVYMGRYTGPEALKKKEDELRRRRLDFEAVQAPAALSPGLALGRYADKPAADEALAALTRQGVHTARVVQVPAEATALHVLRFDPADRELAGRLASLRGEPWGDGFVACAATVAAGDAASAAAR